jgi:hypothetical protein
VIHVSGIVQYIVGASSSSKKQVSYCYYTWKGERIRLTGDLVMPADFINDVEELDAFADGNCKDTDSLLVPTVRVSQSIQHSHATQSKDA